MRRLADAREHLDGALPDRAVLVGNLRDLRRINRRFGGTGLSVRAIESLVGRADVAPGAAAGTIRVLDVGTGAADIPLALLDARLPRPVEVTATDSRQEVLDAAAALAPAIRTTPGLTLGLADGRALPFPDGAFDVAHASLVLHHLEPPAAIELLRELRRVARVGVVVNDLVRRRVGWIGAWLLLHAMTRNPFTLHDGPLSVRRAYTRAELRDLLARAGLRPTLEVAGFAGHRVAIAAVPAEDARLP